MKRYAVLILFVQIIWRTVAQITISTINSTDDAGTFIAGSEVTVICEIQSYLVFMNWKINSNIVAECTFTTCSSKSNLPGHYTFSNDTDSGIFNLTINPVQSSDNGQVLTCENEDVNDTLTVTVKGYKEEGAGRSSSKGKSTIVVISSVFGAIFIIYIGFAIATVIYVTRPWMNVPETRLECNEQTDSSMALSWHTDSARSMWNCFIISLYLDDALVQRSSHIPNTGTDVLRYNILNLKGSTTYRVTLEAKHFCRTKKADMIRVKTLGKPDPPINFRPVSTAVTESSISVKWQPGSDGGYKQDFILLYHREDHGHVSDRDTFPSEAKQYITQNEYYILEILSEIQDRRSPPLKPLKQNRQVASGVTHMGMKWKLSNIHITDGDFMQHKIENLTEKTNYILEIFAGNKAGRSSPTPINQLTVKTKGKPDPPTQFRPITTDMTESSIAVEWKPGNDCGYKQHFILIYSRGARCHAFNNIDTICSEVRKHMTENENYILEIFPENQDRRSSQLKPLKQNPEGKKDLYRQSRLVANDVTKLGEEWRLKTFHIAGRGFVQHNIENLTENTRYIIKIFAENQAGVSDSTEPLNVSTNGIMYAAREDDYGTTFEDFRY